jgi:RecJ-like exonuclease
MFIETEQFASTTRTLEPSLSAGIASTFLTGSETDSTGTSILFPLERHCNNCGFKGDAEKYFGRSNQKRKPTRISDYRSDCKKCRSKKLNRKYIERKAELFPSLYLDCDVCDHIYNKRHDKCPQCEKEAQCH